jgi:hypothetical protein
VIAGRCLAAFRAGKDTTHAEAGAMLEAEFMRRTILTKPLKR